MDFKKLTVSVFVGLMALTAGLQFAGCNKSEPPEYERWPIEATYIYHSDHRPQEFVVADTRPKYVETEEDYHQILKNWGIDTEPFEFDPNESSLMTISSILMDPIVDEKVSVWVGKDRVYFGADYLVKKSEIREEYYELILVKVAKFPSSLPLYERSSIRETKDS